MSIEDTAGKSKEASKSSNDLSEAIGYLRLLNIKDNNLTVGNVCANCGNEGDNMNTCNKCKQVKYCNVVCKKKHRHKHKKDCERRVNELHDIELFKEPPTLEDCPICFLLLPSLDPTGKKYKTCCGKRICSGCFFAPIYDDQGNKADNNKQNECPFCRVLAPKTEKELNEMRKKRMEKDDPLAIYIQGSHYRDGTCGYPQNYTKALELYRRAAELGHATSYGSIGYAYHTGKGVEVDLKKATHYYELAAMGGDASARHNLGIAEKQAGKMDRAVKHLMIATKGGFTHSLESIKRLYSNGHATKDDYTRALRLYQKYLVEIKSTQRDEAAAFDSDQYRYY